MGEMKAAIFSTGLFVAFIIPFLLFIVVDSIQQQAFVKQTTEVTELIAEEGGVTEKVANVVNGLHERNYLIEVMDEDGNDVNSAMEYGDELNIEYNYKYNNVLGERELNTNQLLTITRRNSTGAGLIIPPDARENELTLFSDYSTEQEQVRTFEIPFMVNLLSMEVDSGDFEILDIIGDEVTVKMTNGEPKHTEYGDGEFIPQDTKFVTGQDSASYEDSDGYEGTLERYVANGDLIEGEESFVYGQDKEYYEDESGYSGYLDRYVASGELIPEETKFVTEQESESYEDGAGYAGTLERYVVNGELIPEDTKFVTGLDSPEYEDNDGYVGTLEKSFSLSDGTLLDGEVVQVASGSNHSVILLESGDVYAGGSNSGGQLGDGTKTDRPIPVKVDNTWGDKKVVQVDAGSEHTVFLLETGEVYAVGSNFESGKANSDTPVKIDNPFDEGEVIQVSANGNLNAFVLDTGDAFGKHDEGSFKQTGGDILQIAVGERHVVFLSNSGEVTANGYNEFGQLGIGTNTEYEIIPVKVNNTWGEKKVTQISAGLDHTNFVLETGEVYVTGEVHGSSGRLKSISPIKIDNPFDEGKVIQSSGNGSSRAYLLDTGSVFSSSGGILSRSHNNIQVVVGDGHTVYLSETGEVYSFGDNEFGQLGIGSKSDFDLFGGLSVKKTYSGYVTKPGVDTREWKYEGEVTKPEIDTREWKYQGAVRRNDIDTREWKYQGNVTRPEVDNRDVIPYYQYELTVDYLTRY